MHFRHWTTGCTCIAIISGTEKICSSKWSKLHFKNYLREGLGFFGKRTNQRLEPGSDFNRNVDKKA
jgi:hypothetical protein